MRVLQISSDRSKRGILYADTPARRRQEAYAKRLQHLDIIGFSRKKDGAVRLESEVLTIIPTNSLPLLYGWDALRIARTLPKPDVVSVQDPFETGVVGWLIARRFGVPLHVQVHTDFLSPDYHSRFGAVRKVIARFVLRHATRVRVVSERIKKSLEWYRIAAAISVLPIYVDIDRFRHVSVDAEPTGRFSSFTTKLLVVSRLEPEKNIALAIRSFASVAPHDSCLIVVGEGGERESLQRLAQTLGCAERVFFEGEHDPLAYYALADLVLVPSLYEGYGMVIIEALASGKPVLSTDVGIAEEMGAVIASFETFADTLQGWFKNGTRTGTLHAYPYANFDDYVQAYCADIAACIDA